MTTISVIIPAYNAERTILHTIESVRKQTIQDLEIIAINDGSTDHTSEIIKNIDDSRIKVFDYPNGGASTARNHGITHAQGDYISFIDSDDTWTPNKLEKQLAALQSIPKTGVAYSWTILMVEAKNNPGEFNPILGEEVSFTGDIYSNLLLRNFIGSGSNILAKREAISAVGYFDTNFKSCEDWDYYLRLAAKFHFVLVPEHQIMYRKAIGTKSTRGILVESNGLQVIEKAYQNAPEKLQNQRNNTIARFLIFCGRIYVDSSEDSENIIKAKEKLFQAIKFYPSILLMQNFQILLVKIILKQLLPNHILNILLPIFKQPFKLGKFNKQSND